METFYLFLIIFLFVLAVFDLSVGVSNDAVNFMNSAIGSKAASFKVIMVIAAIGIFVGASLSNGMMDIARHGIYQPQHFYFSEIMCILLAVMLTDVVLLDIFNSLGMPTSTTVSLVFELLGGTVAISLIKIANSNGALQLGDLLNTDKAFTVILAIFLSVAIAFFFGAIVQYISRLIFTFNYKKYATYFIGLFGGLAATSILYFMLIKGLKESSFMEGDLKTMIYSNTDTIVWGALIFFTVLMQILHWLKVNVFKVVILLGTFALALAFAGNDLVNFIGVPMAGIDSYFIALESGDMNMLMTKLTEPAHVNIYFLIASGVVMIVTLFLSKDAMKVDETQLSLSSQNDEDERFGSTKISRALVSLAIRLNDVFKMVVPKKVLDKLNTRFIPDTSVDTSNVSYDFIRAVVNLTAASSLICLGTSLKLPLSTTYVIFMVSMGSSLADRAWGRDSAVYRITGVMVVIMGWFITALAGVTISFVMVLFLVWGGWIALALMVLLCGYILCHSLIFKKKEKEETSLTTDVKEVKQDTDVLYSCTQEVCNTMEQISSIYNHMLVALFTENRRLLKETKTESEQLYRQANERKHQVFKTLKKLEDMNIETGHFYIQVVDYLTEVTKALLHCTRPAFEHIDNHHKGFTKEQIYDLKLVNDGVDNIFNKINSMLREKDFSDLNDVLVMRDNLFGVIAEAIKHQIRRLKEEQSSTKASILYLNILTETKTMVLQSRNLIKSQGYFLSKIETGESRETPENTQNTASPALETAEN